jgi:hypothetical protein
LERASPAASELERGEWRPKIKFQFSSVQFSFTRLSPD